jgi:hypothetical protein
MRRSYTIITPLRYNGKLITSGDVTLDEKDGEPLVPLRALERGDPVKESGTSSPTPTPTPPAAPAEPKPLDGLDAAGLRAIAKEESIRLNPNVKDPAKIAAAIEKARAEKKDG